MRRLTIGLAAALALAIAASSAQGASFTTASSFGFFAGNPDAFLGQVSSPHAACRARRVVRVVRRLARRRTRLIGTARSGPTGQWTIEKADVPRGRYYAQVTVRRVGRHTCRAYRSSTLTFGD